MLANLAKARGKIARLASPQTARVPGRSGQRLADGIRTGFPVSGSHLTSEAVGILVLRG